MKCFNLLPSVLINFNIDLEYYYLNSIILLFYHYLNFNEKRDNEINDHIKNRIYEITYFINN